MPNITITNLTATDANGYRTVTGTFDGKTRRVSLPISELEKLTFEQSQARFVAEFKKLFDAEPKPYPLPFTEITVSV
jgi:hypothetical protein